MLTEKVSGRCPFVYDHIPSPHHHVFPNDDCRNDTRLLKCVGEGARALSKNDIKRGPAGANDCILYAHALTRTRIYTHTHRTCCRRRVGR